LNLITAYTSIDIINTAIANENFNLVDKSNYVLYNEYIKSITSNLKIDYIPTITKEAVESLSPVINNHSIALEGFIASMWEKIKQVIKALFAKVKEFFKRWFTKAGRVKGRLENLKKVLSETKSDIQIVNLDKAPSSLLSKYPFSDPINFAIVNKVTETTKTIITDLSKLVTLAEESSKKDIISKEILERINELKDSIANNRDKVKDVDSELDKTPVQKVLPVGNSDEVKDLKNEKKLISSTIKEDSKELKKTQSGLNKVENSIPDNLTDQEAEELVDKVISNMNKTIDDVVKKLDDQELIGGKKLTINDKKEDDSLMLFEIEDIENKVSSASVILADKNDLLKLVNSGLELLTITNATITKLGKIDDIFTKKLNDVDKVIYELSKIEEKDKTNSKYKKILDKVVKKRLMSYKQQFVGINKISTNLLDMALYTCEGISDYSTLSLKNFS
ncbi:MAG: hypothetical protein ACD_33C00017G0001, partial [uncultured bacterium]